MQVKIIKAGESTYWYTKYIGQVFTVDSYSVIDKEFILHSAGFTHYINHDDCILVSGDIKHDTHGDSKLKFYFV